MPEDYSTYGQKKQVRTEPQYWGSVHVIVLGNRVPALDQANEHHDHRNHEQQVDESAKRIARDEAKEPENQKYHCNGVQHGCCLYC